MVVPACLPAACLPGVGWAGWVPGWVASR